MKRLLICALLFPLAAPAIRAAEAGISSSDALPEGLTEIVVTAERREESLQKAPIAVTALTADDLQKAGFNSQADLTRMVPSVNIFVGGGGATQAFLRGVGSGAGNTWAEQGIAFNLDGEYLARGEAVNGNFFDLARIEILRGPQGTLYGRNASAGAVNLITVKPVLGQLGGDFQAEVGNYGKYSFEGALNVPTGETSALRVAGQRVYHTGYLTDGYNDQDETDGRVNWLWDAAENLTVRASADTSHSGGKGYTGVLLPRVGGVWDGPSTPAQQARWIAAGIKPVQPDGHSHIDNKGGRVQVDWDTPFGTLTVMPTFRELDENTRHYAAGFPVDFIQHSETKSAEARFASPQDQRLTWILGYYYFQEHAHFHLDGDTTGVILTNDINAIDTNSHAEFGQATFKITDTLRLVAGLRYTSDSKSTDGVTQVAPPAFLKFVPFSPIPNSLHNSKTTWKAGIDYDLSPKSLLYATAATGFKAGGFFASPAPGGAYKPESLTSYTIGSKNRFMNDRLQLNAEAYYWKYKDEQVTHLGINAFGGIDQITDNAGDATLYGVEPEVNFLVTDKDLLGLALQYEHAVYDRYQYNSPAPITTTCPVQFTPPAGPGHLANFVVNCSGFPIPNAPKVTLHAHFDHTFDLPNGGNLLGILTGNYRSSMIGGPEEVASEQYSAYTTGDFTLTYNHPGQRASVTAYVYNFTDKGSYLGAYYFGGLGPITVPTSPRLFGLRLNAKF